MCTVTPPVNVSPTSYSLGSLTHLEEEPSIVNHVPANNEQFLRRHSLSLRSPPPGSIAADILSSGPVLLKTKSLLSDMKKMSEQLSEFGSCVSSLSESSGEESLVNNSAVSVQSEKKKKKRKRMASSSPPDKNLFLKKPAQMEVSATGAEY